MAYRFKLSSRVPDTAQLSFSSHSPSSRDPNRNWPLRIAQTADRRCLSLLFPIALTFCLLLTSSPNVYAAEIAPELKEITSNAKGNPLIDVIIILDDQVDTKKLAATKASGRKDQSLLRTEIITALKSKAMTTQPALIARLNAEPASRVLPLWIINAVAATVRADTIKMLAIRQDIAEIRLDSTVTLSDPLPAATADPEWNIGYISAPELWDLGFTGQDVVVANMDTGVDVTHDDLASRWRGGLNSWFDPNGEHVAGPFDLNGHGTRTMGIMVGGDATGAAIGVAPGAKWIAVKIFDDSGAAPLSGIHQGFQWLLDPDGNPLTDDAPDVVNNSWGFPGQVDNCFLEFRQDIEALKSSGIAVVFSAGNEGPASATSISPANNPASFAVGSVDINKNIAATSSRGPSACILEDDYFPEVVAPGVNVKTANLADSASNASATVSGTSFAAPHVAGAMALLLSAFPDAAVSELETSLMDTAEDLGPPGPDEDYGYGLINVLGAYRLLASCTDADGDEYYAEAFCGTEPDCDDDDATIHPEAQEIAKDGVDQDCNGLDLTIDILDAAYLPSAQKLCAVAVSDLGENADLQLVLDGLHPMNWNGTRWEIAVTQVAEAPPQVTVTGTEGSVSTPVRQTEICLGDLDRDGDVDETDLGPFASAFGTTSSLPHYDAGADLNSDGDVDGGDLAKFAAHMGRSDCPLCP